MRRCGLQFVRDAARTEPQRLPSRDIKIGGAAQIYKRSALVELTFLFIDLYFSRFTAYAWILRVPLSYNV